MNNSVFQPSVVPRYERYYSTQTSSYQAVSTAFGSNDGLLQCMRYALQLGRLIGDFQGSNGGELSRLFDSSFAARRDGDSITTTGMQAKMAHIERIGGWLGERSLRRLIELAQFEAGWDGDGACAMSLNSLALLHTFISKMHEKLDPADIGFYLGYDGEIFINWTQSDGALIDLAFRENRVEVYSDAWEQVFTVSDPNLYEMVSK